MELIAVVVEVFIGLVAFILQVLFEAVALFSSSSMLAARSRGLSRMFYAISAIAAIYVIFGLLRGFIPALASPEIGQFFSLWSIALVGAIAIIFSFLPSALQSRVEQLKSADNEPGRERLSAKSHLSDRTMRSLGYLLAIGFVIILGSGWTHQTRVPTMEERFCTALLDHADPELVDTVTGFAETLFGEDLENRFLDGCLRAN